MTQNYDAIIIGAGISGAAIAFELSKKGFKTVNIEKLAAAGRAGLRRRSLCSAARMGSTSFCSMTDSDASNG